MDPKTIIEIQDIATADKLPPSDPATIESNPSYKSPAERANFFSYINFSFMFKTAQTARKLAKQGKALDSETLPGYSYQRRPEVLEQKFASHMQRQKKAGLRKKVKLVLALFSTFKWVMLFNTVIGLLQLGLRIWMAWLAMKLLESIGNPYSSVSEGYKWAGILSGVYIVAIYTDHHCYYNTSMASLQIRSGIISMIYTKIMRLSVYSMNQISLGKIVNIVANDINVFERTGLYFLNIVIGFFGLIGCTAVLWIFFGPSCLVGIGYCLLGFPLLGTLAKRANGPLAKKNIVTDERVKMTNEVIDGIRLLKMYAWELIFKNFIMEIREREVKLLKGATNFESLSRGYALSINCVACFLIWMTYVLTGNQLSSAIVFPSIFLIGLVRVYCIFFLALALNFTMESKLLLRRIEDIIEATEISDTKFQEPVDSSNSVEFKDFTAYWTVNQEAGTLITEIDKKSLVPQENKSTLSDINLNIKKGSLNAVIGKVGSGKSSFLLAFTGEMPKTEGSLRFKGDIAYVEQEPTIFAGTLRDNILFGKPYEANFYNKVIAACNLENDIQLFPLGDRAEIGEKGVNLSGGQKARLSLARAIYSDADIYLLDDPLSAVDTKVAKSLFEEAIKGLLKGKTVILATHQVHFVRGLENIIVIDDGKVIANGSYESLKQQQNVDMASMFSSGLKRSTSLQRTGSSPMNRSPTLPAEIIQEIQESSDEEEEEEKSNSDENKGKLFTNEDKDGDNVSFQTYKSYLNHMGLPFVVLFFFMYLVSELTNVAFGRVVGVWADGRLEKTTALATMGGLTAFAMVIFVLKILFLNRLLLRASQSLHNKMLDKILKSPVQFFDTNPVGRILNRFSNDTGVLDRFLPLSLGDSIDTMFNVISSLIVIAVINPIALAPICIALILVVIVLLFCYHCIQQSKNYELASRSPLYSLFSSSLAGIIVIRSYKQTENFIKQFRTLLYNNTKGGIAFWTSARFFGLSVDIIYSICAVVSIFIIAATKNNSNAGLAGLSLSSLLGISGILQYSLRQGVQSNVLIASVGRIKAYCNLPSEAPLFQPKDEECKKKNWPQEGKIEFNKVFMKYRANTEYVIRDLTLNARAGEKIGCVGRTGAGKSSIIQILFRMVEIDRTAQGTEQSYVNIDGVNSQSIGLHTLRNNISIIPQTPFVFTGNVRRNLDPIGQFTDEQLWKVLEDVNLKAHVEKLEKGLYTDMTNASSVFSVGQKQLVCLARAILKQSKLLVLDEATANVDMETDNFIQSKIMEKFSKCTIFTIAHRLSTIANYDKVLVLDKGKKVEFDEPYKLLVKEVGDMTITNKTGHFASMVLNTGPRTSEDILRVARAKYYEKHSSL